MRTADDMRTDLRRMRANSVFAFLLKEMQPFMRDEVNMRDVADVILTKLHEIGADVVTDAMRAEAGLAPRDEMGWTREELAVLEAKRLEAMLRPITYPAPPLS